MKTFFVLTSDELNKEDVRALLQSVRDCEMTNFPKKLIFISLQVPDLSLEDIKDIYASINPPFEGEEKIFKLKE